MALLLIDSCSAYGTSNPLAPMKWNVLASFAPMLPGRRPGTYCLTTQASAVKYLDAGVDDWGFGFAYWWNGGPATGIAYGQVGGYVSPHRDWQLSVDVAGRLYAQEITLQNPGPTWAAADTLFTCGKALVAGAWNFIELKQDGASAIVRVHGNTVGSGSLASEAQIGFGLFKGAPYQERGFCDIYLISLDAETPDLLGDIGINAYLMALVDMAEWTPKVGASNVAMVRDVPPDEEETYNSTDQPNKTDLFKLDPTAITDLTQQVYGLQLTVRAEHVNTASMDLAPLIVSGVTESLGPQWGLPVGYGNFIHPRATNPATGLPWTVGEILDAKYGYRSLTPAG